MVHNVLHQLSKQQRENNMKTLTNTQVKLLKVIIKLNSFAYYGLIAEELKQQVSTVKNKLAKLTKEGLIVAEDECGGCKVYRLTKEASFALHMVN